MRPPTFAKVALAPVLLWQGRRVRAAMPELPEPPGPREGTVGRGPVRLKLLVFGDSSAAGVGVGTQAEALAEPLARAVAARIGGAVAWTLRARTGLGVARALRWIQESPLPAADVVVSVLGVNEVTGQRAPADFVHQYTRLIDEIAIQSGARRVIVNGVPPMGSMHGLPQPLRWYLGRWARALDTALAEAVATMPVPVTHIDVGWAPQVGGLASDGFHPGAQQYRHWAQHLAEVIAPALD